MGVLGVVAAASASAQTPLLEIWDRIERFAATQYGMDEVADMAAWTDTSVTPNKHWAYVTGYMTNGYGGHFIATYRYDISDGSGAVMDYFPSDFLTTTDDHRGVALVIDPDEGTPDNTRIYVAGYTETNGDKDYVVIKYNKILSRDDQTWASTGYRTFDRGNGSEDVPVDVVVAQSGDEKYAIVVGTTLYETGDDDITSVWYDAADGSEEGVDHYNGPGDGKDTPSEAAIEEAAIPAENGPALIVAGTSWGGSSTHDDLVALLYDGPASRDGDRWPSVGGFGDGVRRWNGPDSGDELCTGISHAPQRQWTSEIAVVIGRTPRYPAYTGDTEYVLWSTNLENGEPFWDDDETGYGEGVRTIGPATAHFQDTAWDAVTQGDSVLVTGDIGVAASTWRVGTFAVSIAQPSGGIAGGGVFGYSDYSDDHGYAISTDEDAYVYVTGSSISTSEGQPLRYQTLRFNLNDLSDPTHEAYYDNNLADTGRVIWVHTHGSPQSPAFRTLLVSGNRLHSAYFLDWGTVRYDP